MPQTVLVVGGDFNVDLGGVADGGVGAITGLMASHGLVDGDFKKKNTCLSPGKRWVRRSQLLPTC